MSLTKLTIVLCLVLASTFSSHSQYFAEQGSVWHYNKTYYSVPEVSYTKVWIEGTETHLGKTCQSVKIENAGSCNVRSNNTCIYENDSAIYLWDEKDTSFKVLFNFKAKVGDTISQEFVSWGNFTDTNKFKIDSISSVSINGFNLKKYFFTPISGYTRRNIQNYIIEKIGFIDFFFGPFFDGACDMSYSEGLRCFESPSFGFYSTNSAQECTYNSVGIAPVKQLLKLCAFPNPCSGSFNLKHEFGIMDSKSILVYNSQGQMVRFNISFDSESTSLITLNDFSSGLYFLEVIDDNGNLLTEKVIIE